MSTEEPIVEEKKEKEPKENELSSDDEQEKDASDPNKKANRGEKKFKKAMGKMGLKPVSGINRVTIKKGKGFMMSIDDPDVWKSPGNQNAYIVFGKPDFNGMQAGQNEVGQFGNPVNPDGPQEPKVEEPTTKTEEAPKNEEPATEDDLNEEGLNPDNIKMVMEYTKCTKAEAIRALRETDDDSVNAIMKLTK